MSLQFYRCAHCGNIAIKLFDKGVPLVCCGEKMQLIEPNTVDAAQEKHVPVVEIAGQEVLVKVGELAHPMTEEHWITNVVLETSAGYQVVELSANDAPEARFVLPEGVVAKAAYEYCNLHGLWKAEI